MRRPHVLGLAVLLAVTLAAPSWGVTLRYRYKAGDKQQLHDQMAMVYEHTMDGEAAERAQMRNDSHLVRTVRSVDGDVASLEVKTTSSHTEVTPEKGKTQRSDDKPESERLKSNTLGVVTERGDKADKKADDGNSPFDPLDMMQLVLDKLSVPEKDVEPGDSWKIDADIPLTGDITAKADIEGTFVRLVRFRGRRAAEINYTFRLPLTVAKPMAFHEAKLTSEGQVVGVMTTYLDLETGQTLFETSTTASHVTFTAAIGGEKLRIGMTYKIVDKTVAED